MTIRQLFEKIGANENLNFLLTNRIPRLTLTHFMGWFSKIRQPWVRDTSIALWQKFADLNLSEAKKTNFDSLHDCFIRELKDGSRRIDPDLQNFTSPCDGILGEMGRIEDGKLYQAKGFPYTLHDLLGTNVVKTPWMDGLYMTIRITSSMYHRFHAPYDGQLTHVKYFSGDTWNVNPVALKRIEKLFCKNERAMLSMSIGAQAYPVALVPVAAVLVASIRLHAIDTLFQTRYQGPHEIACDASFVKGQEMGWFEHGSTILVFVPKEFAFIPELHSGMPLQMGQAIFKLPNLIHQQA